MAFVCSMPAAESETGLKAGDDDGGVKNRAHSLTRQGTRLPQIVQPRSRFGTQASTECVRY
jgi:hypothetical protein